MHRRFLVAVSSVTLLAAGALHLSTGVAGGQATSPLPQTVSITVELDLPEGGSDGPVVYQVTDVPVGDGPELTGADLIANPSGWCGSLAVDVDNVARTITMTPDEVCNFETATVEVVGEGIDTLTTISDELWTTDEEGCVMNLVQASATVGVATIGWTTELTGPTPTDVGSAQGINAPAADCSVDMAEGGASVFSYETPTTPTTETPTTAAPTTEAPAAAPAAVIRPAFTG